MILLKLKQVIYHEKMFPSNKNSFLKGKKPEILSSYIFQL